MSTYTLNYAVHTTSEAAYSYVIPAKSGELRAYVGAAFLTPNQTPKITTIICENNDPGQNRPADPLLVRDPLNPKKTFFTVWSIFGGSSSITS